MKNRRQELILRAVETEEVSTQEQLLAYLHAHGIDSTQATVSRDVRELGLRKSVKRDGKNLYEAASREDSADHEREKRKYLAIMADSVLVVDGAGHMVCLRCAPGMAQGACAALDAMPPEGVVGSLAGEDTIFLLCRNEAAMYAVQEEIQLMLSE